MKQKKCNIWRKRKLAACMVMLVVMVTSAFSYIPVKAADGAKQIPSVEITMPDNKVPTYEIGKSKDFILNIKNNGNSTIKNFMIAPKLRANDAGEWPFKTEYQKYSKTIEEIPSGKTAQAKFAFTQRDDAGAKRYTLVFAYSAEGTDEGQEIFYVNTSEKPRDNNSSSGNNGGSQDGSQAGGGVNNGVAAYSDTDMSGGGGISTMSDGMGGSESGSVPRVIVTGFTTEPAEVRAGSDFTLIIHLKNTSKKSRVGNMLFDLNAPQEGTDEQTSAPAFLPASGSSTVYLEGMKAGGTADISMKLNAKSDLLQKPYSVELSMKYEDADYNQVEASSSLSIPIKQDARFEFSEFQISPDSITVGEEANVMCSLYNMGRLKLYNVKATFEGTGIEKEEVFVGNVEPGSTASIDAMLKGEKESLEDNKVTMTMSYENEEGEIFTEQKELRLSVAEEEMAEDAEAMMGEEVESGGFPIALMIGLIAVVVAIAAAVIIIKKRKHMKNRNDEEELLYELDGTSEDERQ